MPRFCALSTPLHSAAGLPFCTGGLSQPGGPQHMEVLFLCAVLSCLVPMSSGKQAWPMQELPPAPGGTGEAGEPVPASAHARAHGQRPCAICGCRGRFHLPYEKFWKDNKRQRGIFALTQTENVHCSEKYIFSRKWQPFKVGARRD